jgi:glycosyltransferase involved in cell wall biosynthesis
MNIGKTRNETTSQCVITETQDEQFHDKMIEVNKRNIKVLLIGDYPPPYGGIAIHVQSLSNALNENCFDYEIFNIGESRKEKNSSYISVYNGFDLLLKLMIYRPGASHMHLHTNGHNEKSWILIFFCGLFASLLGLNRILTIHSGMAPDFLNNRVTFFKRLFIRLSLAFYKKVICVNREIADAAAKFSKRKSTFVLIPAFIAIGTIEEVSIPERAMGFIDAHCPIVCAVVLFSPEYGIELLIEAIRNIKEYSNEIGLIIIGGGKRSERYLNLEIESGLDRSLLVMEELPPTSCLSIMSAADLFVRPSITDGDSISVREALSIGIPVLASGASPRPEGTILFKKGNLEDLIDKLIYCIENLELLKVERKMEESEGFEERIFDIYREI